MKLLITSLPFLFATLVGLAQTDKYVRQKLTDTNGYKYESVKGDPLGLRIYTLDNGLKLYLSVNKDEPRIQTYIAVKAGSTYDPKETTGLAHYLEHLMFKGSTRIGTIDWEKERVELKKIESLFEAHKNTNDPAEKKALYAQIDSVSQVAARYAIANEYDKMVSSMGAQRTNAYTSSEEVVFMNDIPANELEKWLMLEHERFSTPVFRLFHTELETVYEEYNMGQDNDRRQAYYAMLSSLFPKHPYGQQTTIGRPEHLKNPSLVNIRKYFETYYVPNNMAICMAGDLDFEATVAMADKYFGQLKPTDVKPIEHPQEAPITEIKTTEVFGPEAEWIYFAYRLKGINSKDRMLATLVNELLSNSTAGILDLNLMQKQKVLACASGQYLMNDYGIHYFYGKPRDGQTLDQVKDLMLTQMQKIKTGDFEDWMLPAIINNFRLNEIKAQESNNSRARSFVNAFVHGLSWDNELSYLDDLEKITKQDLMAFAERTYKDSNYVVVYKRQGENADKVKVDKPQITPVNVNRDSQSEFLKEFMQKPSGRMSPVFVDFDKEIQHQELSKGVRFDYIQNTTNELFDLYYIVEMGKDHSRDLSIAVNYLPYLGTSKYSPEELKKEFFKYGLSFGVQTNNDLSYVYVSGLQRNMDKALELMEHVLADAKPDTQIYKDFVDGLLKKRNDAKMDKQNIMWGGLFNYAKYGDKSAFTDILPEKELRSMDPTKLTQLIAGMFNYTHHIFYYGGLDQKTAQKTITKYHKSKGKLPVMPRTEYTEQPTDSGKVLFVDYDMVQTNILLMAKDVTCDVTLEPMSTMYANYFGRGLSSIVFQEIREARALAYTAMSSFSQPDKLNKSHYVYAYVGTQADKLQEATTAMLGLMNEMPYAENQFESARGSVLKQIETNRIIKKQLYFTWLNNRELGINYDNRKDVYQSVGKMTFDDLNRFFKAHVAGKKYTYLVIGKKTGIDMSVLEKLGPITELSLEQLFGY